MGVAIYVGGNWLWGGPEIGILQFHDMRELSEHDVQRDSYMSLDPWTFASGAP